MECTQVDGAYAFELKLRVLVRVRATFQVDPFWPKALPNNWLLGHVIGVAVDSRDHIWVLHRPRSLSDSERGAEFDPPTSECCVAAPSVLEFDQEANVVQSWGGPALERVQRRRGVAALEP